MKHTLRGDKNRNVWLDGEVLMAEESQKVRNHSPDGFAWGYAGSGPSQLALAVILSLTGSYEGYHDFKTKYLVPLVMDKPFEIEFELKPENQDIHVTGFHIFHEGDSSVGIPSAKWEITGGFYFDNQEDMEYFWGELNVLWKEHVGDEVNVQSFEEYQAILKKEDELFNPEPVISPDLELSIQEQAQALLDDLSQRKQVSKEEMDIINSSDPFKAAVNHIKNQVKEPFLVVEIEGDRSDMFTEKVKRDNPGYVIKKSGKIRPGKGNRKFVQVFILQRSS